MVKLLIFNLNLTLFLLCAQGGKELGHLQTDTPIAASPMSRATGGEQDVVVPFRNSLFSFALPQDLTTAITGSAIKVVCPPVRVLIITGGHAFEEDSFFQKFQAMKGITWTHERFPQGAESQLTLEKAPDYDVAVFYDMYQKKDSRWQSWLSVLEQGKPTVFLHHALGSYVDWNRYREILGGHANFGTRVLQGVPNSTFQHDVHFRVHIEDPNHPITAGMKDFDIVDEIYNHYEVKPDVHILLTTDHRDAGKIIGWTHTYGRSPIAYLQMGPDHIAFENQNYRRLVERAILWAAGRMG